MGLDTTRRDLLRAMGDQNVPREIGKNCARSAPIGPFHPARSVGHLTKGGIGLKVDGAVKQTSDLANMIWSVAEQISQPSQANGLFPGDIIYSGTPENVGPVVRGDVIECHIDGLPKLSVKIVRRGAGRAAGRSGTPGAGRSTGRTPSGYSKTTRGK